MRKGSSAVTLSEVPPSLGGTKSKGLSVRKGTKTEIIVLGVDPGTLITGYGVVVRQGNTVRMVDCGSIKNNGESSMPLRLKNIHSELCDVINRHHPDEFAIESAFYGKNAQSALKLGHARGVSILAAVKQDIPTTEYSPREVKRAIVGNGAASKEQVAFMVKSLLGLTNARMLHDTSDALAIAICHAQRMTTPTAKHKDWKSYIEAHPEKIKR
jgi:crossover junction endodeoxyribonuclease RuvC